MKLKYQMRYFNFFLRHFLTLTTLFTLIYETDLNAIKAKPELYLTL